MAESDSETQTQLVVGEETFEIPTTLPVLPVRDVVVFPGVTVPLAIGREKSLAALEQASESGFLIVASQRDPAIEDPQIDDLFPVGCVVRVVRIIDARRHGKQAIVVGVVRTRLSPPIDESPALRMSLDALPDPHRVDLGGGRADVGLVEVEGEGGVAARVGSARARPIGARGQRCDGEEREQRQRKAGAGGVHERDYNGVTACPAAIL